MKKIILLFLLPVFLFVSCISDNIDNCPAKRTLYFKYHCLYDTDDSFDSWIGNDVMLYVFQDKVLKRKEVIPYELIKNASPYSYTKECEGEVDIVAWAVPEGSTTTIPQYNYNDLFNDQYVMHEMEAPYNNVFPKDLHLGVDSLKNDIITQGSTHTIYMVNCACLIDITINDPGQLMQTYDNHYVIVEGVMDKMNLHYDAFGQEAVIYDGIASDNPGAFWSGMLAVLPSADSQTLSFTLYAGYKPLAIVTTDLKAMPGGLIEITINLGAWVSITVDGADWDIYPNVQWM